MGKRDNPIKKAVDAAKTSSRRNLRDNKAYYQEAPEEWTRSALRASEVQANKTVKNAEAKGTEQVKSMLSQKKRQGKGGEFSEEQQATIDEEQTSNATSDEG